MLHKSLQLKRLLAISVLLPLMVITPSCTEEEPTPIAVESVEISADYLTLKEGETAELYATIHPSNAENQKVSWHSDDDTIAEVNRNGHIVAVKAGITTIYVETDDGGYISECTVEVLPDVILVEKVELSEGSLSLYVGDEYQLTADVYPSNATNANLLWISSNTSVITVNQGKLKAINAGSAKITVTTENGKVSATCSVSVQEKKYWGLCGTFNDWGESGNDIPMSDQVSNNYYVASGVSLKSYEVDAFAFRYDNSWDQHRGANEEDYLFYINEKYATAVYDDGVCPIFVLEDGVYDIYLAKTLDYFYIMSKGQKPNDAESSKISVTGVSLNKSKLSLTKGNTYTLTFSVSPSNATDKSVSWQSSNSNVVTVSNGKITAVKEGTAVITVKTNDGGFTAKCEVTVADDKVSVSGITLNKTSITLDEGESYTLTSSISPSNATDKSVTWQSSNSNVVTVSNGLITAVKEGTAVVTVRTNDGGYTAKCNVTVRTTSQGDNITLNSSSTNNISSEANDYVISFSSVNDWNASTDCDWIDITPKSGTAENETINVCIQKNNSTLDRTGSVAIKSGTASAIVTYIQDGTSNSGDNQGGANPNDFSKISLKVDFSKVLNFNWSDKEWEDYINKAYTSSSMSGYGATYKHMKYSNGWIDVCFDGNVTAIPGVLPYAVYAEVIVLPNSVTHIGNSAFSQSNCLSINLPESLQEIGDYAFQKVTCFKDLLLPQSVVSIGQGAFWGCSNVTSITLPSSLKVIPVQAFGNCSKLSAIYIPSTIQKIESLAFHDCTSLRELKIGDNTRIATMEVADHAFQNCTSLTSANVCSEVAKIGCETFKDCNNLVSVTLGGNKSTGTMKIDQQAFAKCVSLSKVTFANEVGEIGYKAFEGCRSIQTLTIPSTVSSIMEGAFQDCSGLKVLVIGDNDSSYGTTINRHAFKGCTSLQSTTLHKSVVINKTTDNSGLPLSSAIFEDSTGDIYIDCALDGFDTNKSNYEFDSPVWDYTSYYVFVNAKFNTITFGSNVIKIGSRFFNYMQFNVVNIGESITEIGQHAFAASKGSTVKFSLNSRVNKIGWGAFYNSSIDNFEMPESVVTIEQQAFEYASFKNFTICSNLSTIGGFAFRYAKGDVTIKCNLSNSSFKSAFDQHDFSSIRIVANYDKINVPLTPYSYKSIDKIIVEGTVKDISKVNIIGTSINEVHICKSVENMDFFITPGTVVHKVYCAPTTPPQISSLRPFMETTAIYVPRSSVSKYKTATGWMEWNYNFVGYDF